MIIKIFHNTVYYTFTSKILFGYIIRFCVDSLLAAQGSIQRKFRAGFCGTLIYSSFDRTAPLQSTFKKIKIKAKSLKSCAM